MLVRHARCLTFPILFFALAGCTTPDDERCAGGYEYIAAIAACVPEGTDTAGDLPEADAAPTDATAPEAVTPTGDDAEAVVDPDAGGVPPQDDGESGAALPEGMAVTCTTPAECPLPPADYCLVDPASGSGACTIDDCAPGDCPGGWTCCDCTRVGMPAFCIPDQNAVQLESLCACE